MDDKDDPYSKTYGQRPSLPPISSLTPRASGLKDGYRPPASFLQQQPHSFSSYQPGSSFSYPPQQSPSFGFPNSLQVEGLHGGHQFSPFNQQHLPFHSSVPEGSHHNTGDQHLQFPSGLQQPPIPDMSLTLPFSGGLQPSLMGNSHLPVGMESFATCDSVPSGSEQPPQIPLSQVESLLSEAEQKPFSDFNSSSQVIDDGSTGPTWGSSYHQPPFQSSEQPQLPSFNSFSSLFKKNSGTFREDTLDTYLTPGLSNSMNSANSSDNGFFTTISSNGSTPSSSSLPGFTSIANCHGVQSQVARNSFPQNNPFADSESLRDFGGQYQTHFNRNQIAHGESQQQAFPLNMHKTQNHMGNEFCRNPSYMNMPLKIDGAGGEPKGKKKKKSSTEETQVKTAVKKKKKSQNSKALEVQNNHDTFLSSAAFTGERDISPGECLSPTFIASLSSKRAPDPILPPGIAHCGPSISQPRNSMPPASHSIGMKNNANQHSIRQVPDSSSNYMGDSSGAASSELRPVSSMPNQSVGSHVSYPLYSAIHNLPSQSTIPQKCESSKPHTNVVNNSAVSTDLRPCKNQSQNTLKVDVQEEARSPSPFQLSPGFLASLSSKRADDNPKPSVAAPPSSSESQSKIPTVVHQEDNSRPFSENSHNQMQASLTANNTSPGDNSLSAKSPSPNPISPGFLASLSAKRSDIQSQAQVSAVCDFPPSQTNCGIKDVRQENVPDVVSKQQLNSPKSYVSPPAYLQGPEFQYPTPPMEEEDHKLQSPGPCLSPASFVTSMSNKVVSDELSYTLAPNQYDASAAIPTPPNSAGPKHPPPFDVSLTKEEQTSRILEIIAREREKLANAPPIAVQEPKKKKKKKKTRDPEMSGNDAVMAHPQLQGQMSDHISPFGAQISSQNSRFGLAQPFHTYPVGSGYDRMASASTVQQGKAAFPGRNSQGSVTTGVEMHESHHFPPHSHCEPAPQQKIQQYSFSEKQNEIQHIWSNHEHPAKNHASEQQQETAAFRNSDNVPADRITALSWNEVPSGHKQAVPATKSCFQSSTVPHSSVTHHALPHVHPIHGQEQGVSTCEPYDPYAFDDSEQREMNSFFTRNSKVKPDLPFASKTKSEEIVSLHSTLNSSSNSANNNSNRLPLNEIETSSPSPYPLSRMPEEAKLQNVPTVSERVNKMPQTWQTVPGNIQREFLNQQAAPHSKPKVPVNLYAGQGNEYKLSQNMQMKSGNMHKVPFHATQGNIPIESLNMQTALEKGHKEQLNTQRMPDDMHKLPLNMQAGQKPLSMQPQERNRQSPQQPVPGIKSSTMKETDIKYQMPQGIVYVKKEDTPVSHHQQLNSDHAHFQGCAQQKHLVDNNKCVSLDHLYQQPSRQDTQQDHSYESKMGMLVKSESILSDDKFQNGLQNKHSVKDFQLSAHCSPSLTNSLNPLLMKPDVGGTKVPEIVKKKRGRPPKYLNSCGSPLMKPKKVQKHKLQDRSPGTDQLTKIRYKVNGADVKPEDLNLNQSLVDRLANNLMEVADCSCLGPDHIPSEATEGPYYTQLGASKDIPGVRKVMEQRTGVSGSAIRIEKVIFTGKEGKSREGCPVAKWIIRRSGPEEKYLVVVRKRPGHFCDTAVIIVSIVAWEGVDRPQADDLYDFLITTLPESGLETDRRCGLNEKKTCACQGVDLLRRGASFSFGCSWSMYYNGCKFARSQVARKFKLKDAAQEVELDDKLQTLATDVAPLYGQLAPDAFRNQTQFESQAGDCRLGRQPGRPFSGVTAVVDFCCHSHRDGHNMNNGSTVVVNLTKHRGFEKPDDEQYHVLPLYILDQTDEFGSMQGQIEKVQRGSLEVLSRYRTQVRMRSTPYRPCKRNRTTPKKQGLKKSPKKIKLAKSKSFPPGKYQENGEKNGENKFSEDGFFLPSSPADEVRSDRSQGTAAPGVGLEERKQENMSYTDLMSQQGTPGFNDLYTNFWDYFYTHGEFPPREWTSKRKFSVPSKAVSNGYSSNSVSQPPAADQMFLHQQQQRQWQHQEQQRQQQQQQLNIKVQDQNRQQQRQQVSPHHVAANKGFHFTAPSPQTPFPLMSPRQHSPHPQNHQWTSSSVAGITKTSQTSAMPQSPASLPLQATHGPQHISNVPGPPTPIPPDALHLQASNAAQSNTSLLSQTSNGQSQRSQFPAVSQSSFSSTASFNSHNLHSIEPNTLQHPQDARSCPPNNVNSCNDSKIMASHSNFTREANMFSHMSLSSQDSTGHKFNMSESNTTAERDVKEGQGPFNLKQVTRHVPYHHKHMSYPYTRQDALPQPISSYTSQGVLSSLNKNVAQREHSGYVPAHEISSTYCDTRSPQGQHMYQSGRAAAGHLVQRSISEHSGSRPSSTQPIERPASEQLLERPGSVQAELSFVADQLSGRSISAHSLQRPSSAQGPASNQSVERPSSTHSIHDSIFRPPSAHSLERPPSQSFGGTQFAQSMQIPPSIQPARRATSVPSVDRPHSAQLEHAASPVQFLARPVSAQPGEGSSPVTSGQFSVHQLTGHKPSPELRASPKVEMQSDVTRFTLQLPESSIHKKPGFFSPLQSGSSMTHISSVSCDSQLRQSVNRQCWLGLNEPAGESAVTRPPTSSNESCHSGDQGRGQLNKLVVDVLKGQQNIKSSHLPQNQQVHSDVRSEQFNVEDNNHQSGHMNMPRLGQMAQDTMHKEQTFGFGRNHHGIGADSGYRKQTSLSVGYGGQITDNHGEMERKNSLHEPAVPVNAVPYIQGQNPVGTLSNQRPGQHLLHAPPQRNSIFGEGSGNVHTSEQNSGSMSAHPIPSSHGSTEGPQRIVSALMSQGTGTGLPNQFSHNNLPLSGQDTTVYPNGLMAGEMMKVHKSEGFVVPKHDQGPSEPPYSVIDSTVISEKVDDNREVFEDPAMGGVAIALCHGAVLFEVAKRELHATTALKEPNRYQPKRISLVFYQHKNLNLARHGYDEYERKAEERRNQAEQARLIEEMESKGFFKGELSELAAFPNLQNGTFGKVFDFPESKKPLFPLRFPRYLDCSPQEQITPVLFACMSIAFPKYMKEAFPNPNPMGLPRLMYGRMPVRMNSSLSDKRKNGHQEDMEQLDKNLKFMIEKYVECGGSQQDQRYIWNPNIPQGHSVTTNSIITRWVHDDTSVTGPYNKWVEMVLQEAVRSKAGTNKNETGADKEENVTENPSQHDTHEHVKERDLQTNVPTDKEPSGPSQTSQEVVTSTAAQLSHPEQSHSTSVPGPVPRSGSSAEGRLQLSPSDNSDGHNSVTSMDRSHDHLPKDHTEAAALMNPTETENCKTNDYMNCLWPEVDVVSDKSGHFATTNKKIYENNGFSQKVFERSQPVSGYFTKKEDRAKYVGSHKIQGGESIENHLSNKIMKCDESDRAGTNRSVPANLYPNNHVRSLGNNQLVQEETNDTSPGKRNQIATYTGNKDMLALKQDMISVSDNPLGEFTIDKEICAQGNITETTYLKQEVHADPPLQVSKHAPLSDKPDGHPSSSANIEAEVTEQKYQCEQGQEKAFHDAGKRESMYDFIMKGLKEPFSSRQLYNTPNIHIPFAGGNCGDSNVPRQCETAADGNA